MALTPAETITDRRSWSGSAWSSRWCSSGASANVVITGIAKRNGHPISFVLAVHRYGLVVDGDSYRPT